MSKFLAPIHTWLFNKIMLAQDLEQDIIKLHIDKYKDENSYNDDNDNDNDYNDDNNDNNSNKHNTPSIIKHQWA